MTEDGRSDGSSPHFAYLSGGRLHVRDASGERSFASEFGEKVQERTLQVQRRNSWKAQGAGALFQSGGLSALMVDQDRVGPVAISSLCRGRGEGEIFYCLETQEVTGAFSLDMEKEAETRLFHSNEIRLRGLAPKPGEEQVACSVAGPQGTVHLALLDTDRGGMTEITEGDSVDEMPSWDGAHPTGLLYQSAGIARGSQGEIAGFDRYSIQQLDFDRGEVECLAEESGHDLLAPRRGADGSLFYIRRPHDKPRGSGPLETLRGILLFPFHFFLMLFQIVNNYTSSFSRKPLIKAGSRNQEMDERFALWGQLVDFTERGRGRRQDAEKDPEASLVPKTWQLIRRDDTGRQETLAKGVLSFDLAPDGSVVYSNGSAVYHLAANGRRHRLAVAPQIRQVIAL